MRRTSLSLSLSLSCVVGIGVNKENVNMAPMEGTSSAAASRGAENARKGDEEARRRRNERKLKKQKVNEYRKDTMNRQRSKYSASLMQEARSKLRTNDDDFIKVVKFRNPLPPVPFDPKFLKYPVQRSEFTKYKKTSLEKGYVWASHLPAPNVSVTMTLDPLNTEASCRKPPANVERDYAILREIEKIDASTKLSGETGRGNYSFSQRSRELVKGKTWLLKPQYLDNDTSVSIHNYTSGIDDARAMMEELRKENLFENVKELIAKSFVCANEDIDLSNLQHPTNSTLKCVECIPLIPDMELSANDYHALELCDPVFPSSDDPENASSADATAKRMNRGFFLVDAISTSKDDRKDVDEDGGTISHLVPTAAGSAKAESIELAGSYDPAKISYEGAVAWMRDYTIEGIPFGNEIALIFGSSNGEKTVRFIPLDGMKYSMKRKKSSKQQVAYRKKKRVRIARRGLYPDEQSERENRRLGTMQKSASAPSQHPATSNGQSAPDTKKSANIWGDSDDDSDAD